MTTDKIVLFSLLCVAVCHLRQIYFYREGFVFSAFLLLVLHWLSFTRLINPLHMPLPPKSQ